MRLAPLTASLVLLLVLWMGPLPDAAVGSFTAHMVLHMGVVAVVAPLLALSLAGMRADPARLLPRLFSAIPAAAIELIVVWGWHAPLLHHAARHSGSVFALEQGSFLAAGFMVWMASLGGPAGPAAAERRGSGVVALLLTSMHMTLLGALLALTPRPLYHAAAGAAVAPLDDQQLGGAVMLLVGGVAYLTGGLWLSRRLLAPPEAGSFA